MKKKVLFVSHDIVGKKMSGAGLKNWEMAQVISKTCDVTLAAPQGTTIEEASFQTYIYTVPDPELEQIARQCDVILLSGTVCAQFPFFQTLQAPIVFDLWIPLMHESREIKAFQDLHAWHVEYQEYVRLLNSQLRRGDFFICACEQQRDYYIGLLEANLRVTPELYEQDRTLRHLIDVVPIGLSSMRPLHEHPVLRGIVPGIAPEDRIILWFGGIWEWFDPLTPINAVSRLIDRYPSVRLVFVGGRHPNTQAVAEMHRYRQAVALSQELGLYGRHIFFVDWIPYEERQNYLLEADVGISAHFEHLETHYAFRTRVLDYVWSGLPMVVTEGDAISDIVAAFHLGQVAGYQDADSWVQALSTLLEQPDLRSMYAERFACARQQFTWDNVCRPLVRFCESPHRAADAGLYQTEFERVVEDKDRYIAGLEDALSRYHRTPMFRIYFKLQEWLTKIKGAH